MSDPKDWTRHLAVRAAWMSFSRGKTQSEIARLLGVSQAKVHRLIAFAQSEGLIRIEIAERPLECLELEEDLAETFGLRSCVVAPFEPMKNDTDDEAIEQVARVASGVLATWLESKKVKQIGVGMGRTLKATIERLPRISRNDLNIVSVSGSLTRKLSANPYDVVQAFSDNVGGDGYFLPVPYLARSLAEKEMFQAQDSVAEMLAKARNSDLFVIGIGSLGDDGHLISNRMISEQERDDLVQQGAVGDLMGRFLNLEGQLIETHLGNQAVGLHFEEVRGARVLALVGGASKVDATRAALSSRIITDLAIDQTLAALVLKSAKAKQIRVVK
jgi:DNA-binding transcriptional regulator LsrR (DeoR family)